MFSNLWILLTALLRKIFMLELDGSIRFSLRVGSAREPGGSTSTAPSGGSRSSAVAATTLITANAAVWRQTTLILSALRNSRSGRSCPPAVHSVASAQE